MHCAEPPSWWVERWPTALAALAGRQVLLALSPDEVQALGRANGIGGTVFAERPPAVLAGLQARLGAAIDGDFAAGAFVRLGSRSAKDTPAFLASGGRAVDGAGALALLGGGSRRLAFDLRRCVREGWPAAVVLRPWQPMAAADEWRGFIDRGALAGLCPAHADTAAARPLHAAARLAALARRIAPHLPQGQGVFDAWLPAGDGPALLLDLNPWGPPTDGVLFDWAQPFDGTLRWAAQRRPLAVLQPATG